MAPFERPALGPWLREDAPSFDVLVAWRLDRVSRSALDALKLVAWLSARGRTLVTTADGIDTGTAMGQLFVAIVGALAQAEREATVMRTLDSRAKLRATGRHGAGQPPYGYKLSRLATGGARWVQDADRAAVVRDLAQQAICGTSITSLVQSLISRGVPAPGGGTWRDVTVGRLLKNPGLIGQAFTTPKCDRPGRCGKRERCTADHAARHKVDRQIVHEDGVAVLYTDEPILAVRQWAALQAALADRGHAWRENHENGLAGLIICDICDSAMIASGSAGRESYVCRRAELHPSRMSNAVLRRGVTAALDAFLEPLRYAAWVRRVEPDQAVSDALRARCDELTAVIDRLAGDREAGRYDGPHLTQRYDTRMAELTAQLAEASEAVNVEREAQTDRWEPGGTDFYTDYHEADDAQRRVMLKTLGVTIRVVAAVARRGDPALRCHVQASDVAEAIRTTAPAFFEPGNTLLADMARPGAPINRRRRPGPSTP